MTQVRRAVVAFFLRRRRSGIRHDDKGPAAESKRAFQSDGPDLRHVDGRTDGRTDGLLEQHSVER